MRVVCKRAWGSLGRGYAIYRNGEQVTGVHWSPASAWAAYRRDCK